MDAECVSSDFEVGCKGVLESGVVGVPCSLKQLALRISLGLLLSCSKPVTNTVETLITHTVRWTV